MSAFVLFVQRNYCHRIIHTCVFLCVCVLGLRHRQFFCFILFSFSSFFNFSFFLGWGFKLQLRADILFRYQAAIGGRARLRIHLVEDEFSEIRSGRGETDDQD